MSHYDISQKDRPIVLGEVLFDRFPTGEAVLGGAPFNVAWHLQGFGCRPLFISRVGEDPEGEEARSAMAGWGMDCSALQRGPDYPTGEVRITLERGQPNFHILPDQAYDHLDIGAAKSVLDTMGEGGLFYHGTLILRRLHGILEALLADATRPVFVDVNLRDPWWDAADLPPILERARWVKVNDEELSIIADRLGQGGGDWTESARRIRASHALELLIVTRGEWGATAFHGSGETVDIAPQETKDAITDTVGAGDAFSAVVIVGLLRGWSLSTMMRAAQAFASRVCRLRGAISRDGDFYDSGRVFS
uniref:Fructokinase n=1 Tax=Candidatus Kentrum sp. UNK TaxID=2126344 RepID=A0A451A8F2_9GAMM|nr:MAG: fructokinase [Candidatus Kentron sp. UNK]VFK70402.1 MAG: fructokinase [Candidatus Kentron sp. UNK]